MTESPEPQPAAPGRIRRIRAKLPALPALPPLPTWWPLPVCAVLGTVCGVSYGALTTPSYTATSYVVATAAKGTDPAAALGFAQAYGRITTTDSTLAYARVAAGVPPKELRGQVQAETSPDSPMIAITGTSTKPAEAADIANAVADAVLVSSASVSKNTGVKLLAFSQAIPPTESASPSVPIGAAVGLSTGGLIGGLILLVRPRRARTAGSATVPGPATEPASASASANAERELV